MRGAAKAGFLRGGRLGEDGVAWGCTRLPVLGRPDGGEAQVPLLPPSYSVLESMVDLQIAIRWPDVQLLEVRHIRIYVYIYLN